MLGDDERFRKRTWRASWQLRTLCAVGYTVPVIIAVASVTAQETVDDPTNLAFVPIAGLMVLWLAAMAFGPCVSTDGESITVVNVLITYVYPLASVATVESQGRSFLGLRLVDGRLRSCWAIQATNLMLMMGKPTRVDQVANEVRDATRGRLGGASTAQVAKRWSGVPMHGWIIAGGIQLLGVLWLLDH